MLYLPATPPHPPEEAAIIPNTEQNKPDLEIIPAWDMPLTTSNQVWAGSFQLVWNDLINELLKQPVEFEDYSSAAANALNQQSFTKQDLSPDSYYTKWGLTSLRLKQEIEQGLENKFNNTSSLLNNLSWTQAPNKYTLYAMLQKRFEFPVKFKNIGEDIFYIREGITKRKTALYFGGAKQAAQNADILFYNGQRDLALSLHSQKGDIMHLYKTDDPAATLADAYKKMKQKAKLYQGTTVFSEEDEFQAPMLDFKALGSFDELCGHLIKTANNRINLEIDTAIQSIEFALDETGARLKTEAEMDMVPLGSLPGLGEIYTPKRFIFNEKYFIFIEEPGKAPYFAMQVKDPSSLQLS